MSLWPVPGELLRCNPITLGARKLIFWCSYFDLLLLHFTLVLYFPLPLLIPNINFLQYLLILEKAVGQRKLIYHCLKHCVRASWQKKEPRSNGCRMDSSFSPLMSPLWFVIRTTNKLDIVNTWEVKLAVTLPGQDYRLFHVFIFCGSFPHRDHFWVSLNSVGKNIFHLGNSS